MPGLTAYCTSKHAVSATVRALKSISDLNFLDHRHDQANGHRLRPRSNPRELPGATETPTTAPQLSTKQGQEAMANLAPWNAIGRPEDIADAALFLASDEA